MRHRSSLNPFALACLLAASAPVSAQDWSASINGNMQLDWFRIDDGDTLDATSAMRRARLALGLRAPAGFDARVEYDVDTNVWTDAFLRWRQGPHSVRLGQFKQPIFLDELTSDRQTLFMEQGLPSSFALARRIGAEYSWASGPWRLAASAHGGNLLGLQKGNGVAGRALWAPRTAPGNVLHLGLALASESPDSETARFSSRLEGSGALAPRSLDTGNLAGVDRIRRSGIEALWIKGPWTLKGEYMRADVERAATSDSGFSGAYIEASWFPGGQQRGYRDGALDGPVLGDGQAVELALRVSTLDLDDGSVRGGDTRNWTAGLNWYLNRNVRLMANYVHVDGERRGNDIDPCYLQARVQMAF